MKYDEGDIILCTVTNIDRTTVFVETEGGTKGSIVFSEIAPGRIRNIRDYVVPKKVIVCKIMQIKDNHIFLSLRRVKAEERKDLLEEYKKEKTYSAVIKKLIGESHEKVIEEIKKHSTLVDFFDDAKQKPEILERYFNKEQIDQIKKIIVEKKEKKEIKKEFKLSSQESDGIKRVKEILSPYKDITYLGSSKYSIKIISEDLKKASQEINEIIDKIEKEAKKQKCFFETKK